ncbi:MAG: UDP-N-acetylmuramoyl-L-alanine--D-glutamate ligase [Candidatus Improbicoccus pseudotrichonymphae]|uniref:UDP-N-acetylmuramoylalanine--D-glutamate ligase n=1 Tax=Candidatus Improbicoccus pseudotrichonymphae TaxID=3033792 RepID=A0AA48KZF1_9FIRM|nr:MAG: UDP-N-acetylmuramoyl-L-alanine--D-glutamate ligase [Candidatus Improbicoccus pseudotrichonymphae]
MKNEIINYLKDKKITLLGLAKSNLVVARMLSEFNIPFSVCDRSEKLNCDSLSNNKNINWYLGEDYLKHIYADIIFRSPGISYSMPEIEKARLIDGSEITSETEIFFRFSKNTTIGITGSDGKTTTSTIIFEIFKNLNLKVLLGGNNGYPLLSFIDDIQEKDTIISELSSFQLISMKQSPDISIITNLSPNHLDIHKSLDEYIDAKKNIFKYQNKNSFLILNYENKNTLNFQEQTPGKTLFFSTKNKINKNNFENYLCVNKKDIIVFKYKRQNINIIDKKEIKIIGEHNLKNFLAAIGAVLCFYIKKSEFENNIEKIKKAIAKTAKEFSGVEHRIEFVRELNKIKFYNDSIASTPTRTIEGSLKVFKNIILICGGYDKNLCYDILAEEICKEKTNVKILILMGQTAKKIEMSIRKFDKKKLKIIKIASMEDAVKQAWNVAEENDSIVLSPASASFDMYKNYEERGNHFKDIVNSLFS